ncbi:LysR family transcriptional regulator [Streptomyces sp. NPDC052051]|uniref:LysR family transcriptional regulator n=1 Tax=Streptomyces sp. NPDC052051 TaxID=3154649 RepID=UPI00343DF5AB
MNRFPEIELRHLRYAAAIAEAGTVTEAARRLHIAQPSLSQQLAALERRVGTRLFERTAQGMRLTAAGRVLLDSFDRAADELRAGLALAREQPLPTRVGLCRGVSRSVLARVEELATVGRPLDLAYEPVDSYRQAELLRTGRLDLGVLRPPVDAGGLTTYVLSDEPLGIVLDRRHPLAERPTLAWADLTDLRLLWFSRNRAPGYAAAVLAHLRTHGWTPSITVDDHAGHTLFRHALLTHPDLVALRPRALVADDSDLAWRAIAPDPPHEVLALAARTGTLWERLLPTPAQPYSS